MLSSHLTSLVAARLGLPAPQPATTTDVARSRGDESTPDTLLGALRAFGTRIGLSWIAAPEGADAARAVFETHPGPVVLVTPDAEGLRAQVALERRGARWRVVRIATDGARTEDEVEPSVLVRAAADPATRLLLVARLVDRPAEKRPSGPLARLAELASAEKGHIALVYLYATLVGLFSLTLPLGVQATIGLVSGGLILQPVVLLVTFVVFGTLAYGGLSILQLSVVETIQQRLFARFALELVDRLPRLALERRAGEDLTERMNRFLEVLTIQKSGAKLLVDGSTALLQVIFGLLLLTGYHPYFALFGAALVLLLAGILRYTGPKGLATSIKESSYKYRTLAWLEEVARGAATFKFAARSSLALSRMDEHVSGYIRYRRAHFRVLVQQKVAMVLFKTAVTGGLLVLGSVLVIDRQITLGQFVASELVVVTVIAGIEKLIASLADVYDLLTSVEKLDALRDLELEPDGGLALPSRDAGMAVELRDVSFTYPEAKGPTLRGLDLRVGAGERVGVVGVFGSGESTLMRVLSGVYGSIDGMIAYDGITRADLDATHLRQSIGQVLSGETLFEATVEENITLGRPGVTVAAVLDALRAVGAAEFVQAMPHGLRTVVSTGGRTLPASMALRILLARAIVTRPRLLLLDEMFSTLAPADRRELTTLLTAADAPWTLIAVSHDEGFLQACDRVLMLANGRIAVDGPWRRVASIYAEQEAGR